MQRSVYAAVLLAALAVVAFSIGNTVMRMIDDSNRSEFVLGAEEYLEREHNYTGVRCSTEKDRYTGNAAIPYIVSTMCSSDQGQVELAMMLDSNDNWSIDVIDH